MRKNARMSSTEDKERAARADITTVIHRYASLARENADWDALATLFAPNAVYRLPHGVAVDPSRMAEVVRGNEAKYIRHHVTTVDIEFVGDDEAHTEAFHLAVTERASPDHWGMWKDVFRRVSAPGGDGRRVWLIQDRTIVVEGAAPTGWYATTYGMPPDLGAR